MSLLSRSCIYVFVAILMNMILFVDDRTILGAHIVVSGGVVGLVTCCVLYGLGVRYTTLIQTGPGVHPASCEMCTGSLLLGVNQSDHGIDHLP
jgi:hypothetical protein